MTALIRNQDRLLDRRTLIVTGGPFENLQAHLPLADEAQPCSARGAAESLRRQRRRRPGLSRMMVADIGECHPGGDEGGGEGRSAQRVHEDERQQGQVPSAIMYLRV